MNSEELRRKIKGIKRGDRVKIVPMSLKNGDPYTSIGIPCTTPARELYNLDQPFFATLDFFDGEIIWLSSEEHSCMKVHFDDLKDVALLINVPTNVTKPVLIEAVGKH